MEGCTAIPAGLSKTSKESSSKTIFKSILEETMFSLSSSKSKFTEIMSPTDILFLVSATTPFKKTCL